MKRGNRLRGSLAQLIGCHVKAYLREPEAVFWTYGFPILMVLGLGLAFRNPAQVEYRFAFVESEPALELSRQIPTGTDSDGESFRFDLVARAEGLEQLRRNRIAILVEVTAESSLVYHFDDANPDSRTARLAVDNLLQSLLGRRDAATVREERVDTPGSRYVDFLVPGLIGMNLMGGGIWGVGFVLVDMRVKKLLKRLIGTPMPRYQLLLSLVGSRGIFFLPEGFVLVVAAYLIFQVPILGSVFSLAVMMLVGALCFTGLGLLIASRARRLEVVSGLMNVVMLPMWLCSGIFFSAERFPDWMQPAVQILPLTQLINALRAIMLDGASLQQQLLPLAVLAAWGGISFLLAFFWFRWSD